jgi:acyl-CoA dehydrogenase
MAINYAELRARSFDDIEHHYSVKDSILYALSLGLGQNPLDPRQLRYVYEDNIVALPTMAVVLASPGFWLKAPDTGVDWPKVLHGEQGLAIHRTLPAQGQVVGRLRIDDVIDKGAGRGALLYTTRELLDAESGALLCSLTSTTFLRGDGGFGGPSGPVRPPHPTPEGPPDAHFDWALAPNAALLYRLNGDFNPIHADPAVAGTAGFDRPILHGLASFATAMPRGCGALMCALPHRSIRVKPCGPRSGAPQRASPRSASACPRVMWWCLAMAGPNICNDAAQEINMLDTVGGHQQLRDAIRALCAEFPAEYHRKIDEARGYPEAFVEALTKAGWLAALIPEDYGGSGLGLTEASIIMEEINRSGGNSGACHGQMYNMGTLLRHGSAEQKRNYLPKIASGALRLQSMGVTEPTTGTDTTKLRTVAVRKGDRYVINGQKVWISRVQHSDLMILLARTTPLSEVTQKSHGMSIFIVDLRQAIDHGLTVRPIPNMVNHETNELFFDNLEIPAENLIGEEGKGFKYILDGLNAERALIAAECIGDGYWFIDKIVPYVKDRIVFDRPIGQNQGVQFPIAEAYIELEAANLMRFDACRRFDAQEPCGAQANMAKYLAAKASWEAANACLQFHGGFGFACEYDVERKFRETRLYQVAPISTNLILSYVAEHVLGLPRSF